MEALPATNRPLKIAYSEAQLHLANFSCRHSLNVLSTSHAGFLNGICLTSQALLRRSTNPDAEMLANEKKRLKNIMIFVNEDNFDS